MPTLRIATFNLENLDDGPHEEPPLATRVAIMRPQIERVNADILCLQEVHSQGQSGSRSLAALDQLLAGTDYADFDYRESTRTVSGELYDDRNIVTISRFPITHTEIIRDSSGPRPSYQMVTAEPPDTQANPIGWERPLLYTRIDVACKTLHQINVHLKSKIPSNIPGRKINRFAWETASAWAEGSFISSMKRVAAALQVRLLVDDIFDNFGEDARIAIAGDFNAEARDVPLLTIFGRVEDTGNPDHATRLIVPCENNVPESSRYSLWHLGKGQMLDHVLASRPLLQFLDHAEIQNEALPDESGAFRQDTKFPESDHAPVVAEFRWPN